MSAEIAPARSPADYADFGALVRAYLLWCRTRYRHDAAFVEEVFGYQDVERELRELAATYGPPHGMTLLARDNDPTRGPHAAGAPGPGSPGSPGSEYLKICGGGAYRRLPDGSCEMKRLFVSDAFKGLGIGLTLGEALIESAHREGYALMRLDTGSLFTEAIALYRKLGFTECSPYREYPQHLLPYLIFMERPLR